MIKVLIVEDDPMVAEINKLYLKDIPGFYLIGTASSAKEAITIIEENDIDLLLLDIYMSSETGIDLLKSLRSKDVCIDVILITAASDNETIQTAFRYGSFDYLIKPFTFDRFKQGLEQYRERTETLKQLNQLNQLEIDRQVLRIDNDKELKEFPKGLTKATLKLIFKEIITYDCKPFVTEDIALSLGISRVSVRKYLRFITDMGILEENEQYGSIGRPIFQYQICKEKEAQIDHFFKQETFLK
ncbi:response regulator [Cytobacillus dafuensis]|uniref:Response regulator n=1 Tax=Cytobacillus dafuensis TaxID=1742359 RepID=A0A5B8Z8I6_CYTDA|nr:response regulator [Cytobacillus dafuensis]QED49422.1 response regulator [Cytobacillus dafuensis]